MTTDYSAIGNLIDNAQSIAIVQADNPDADSLGSALALEQLLGSRGKQVQLYCGVDMPAHLRYIEGWDRVAKDLPRQFDLGIIVDAGTLNLLESLKSSGQLGWLKSKPCVVLDHHETVDDSITFAEARICDSNMSSTGELIFEVASQLGWKLDQDSGAKIMASILGDTQGMTNDLAQANTYRVMASLLELGISRPALEEARREFSKMDPVIFKYKARLIGRTEFTSEGKIAHVTVPQDEINQYSPLYNPKALVQFDMLQVKGVLLSLVFKTYDDGKLLCAIRANHAAPIAGRLAEAMGGGGHNYASGFKKLNCKDFEQVISNCLDTAAKMLSDPNSNP